MKSAPSYCKQSNKSMKSTTIPPRRGQIKRRIFSQIANSAVSVALKATNIVMKNRGSRKVDSSSSCVGSPSTPPDAGGLISDGISDSGSR
ncbi:hypothetical protein SSX86_013290 [Deinandra increscens subsp. villosa]|uniref:Uncharacterized protein n=1 Tax=Deinandra increscens subsp. villosa TaxID=3103831 RepID=A0AAP0DDC6_9ASTR